MDGNLCVPKRIICTCQAGVKRTKKAIKCFPVRHEVLQKRKLNKNGRLIVVGDIHGCHTEFLELLGKCDYNPGVDKLLLLGDLVSKGPKSTEVLSEAMGFGALSVRGNHDHGALVAFNTLREGGQVKEIWKWAQDLTLEQARYIAAMPFVMSVPTYRIIAVHAGLVASVTMKRQRWQDLCSMYNVVTRDNPRSRRVGTSNRTRGESWQGLWKGPLHVLYGHAAKTTVQFRPFTTCIDTGCVYGNLLSAAIFPRSSKLKPRSSVRNWSNLQGKLVSVKAHKAYEEW